ncbi:hypothetical protein FUAX_09800 [Fulvitalea axinellae]|uniref:Uncharacterized protein n=1 Tax=Fulvitalea axinellae TaxID=1182444 RepID=A0AAU9CF52_9BACT|nr:hypothetical protein FUAX_09800 [Fulvitalea axinellae]
MPEKTTLEISVRLDNPLMAGRIREALEKIASNIDPQNLKTLAEKSEKKGINDKIRKFKNFI